MPVLFYSSITEILLRYFIPRKRDGNVAVYNRFEKLQVDFNMVQYVYGVTHFSGNYKNLKDVYFGIYELSVRKTTRFPTVYPR